MTKLFKVLRKAVRDRAAERPEIEPLPASVRIDGKTCLVTGANSGVGRTVAIDLARRGGHVLMACRSGHPEAGEDVKAASGSDRVEMLRVDLSDMRSVHRLCDELRERRTMLDIAVLNAGLMPRRASRTAQGFETMFAVHFLANRVLVDRWLTDGTVRPANRIEEAPRIVIVSSDAHPLRRADRLRPPQRVHGLRGPGRDQALRREQARPLHLRDGTLASPEPRRRGPRAPRILTWRAATTMNAAPEPSPSPTRGSKGRRDVSGTKRTAGSVRSARSSGTGGPRCSSTRSTQSR